MLIGFEGLGRDPNGSESNVSAITMGIRWARHTTLACNYTYQRPPTKRDVSSAGGNRCAESA